AIYLVSTESGDKIQLTSPPKGTGGDTMPAFSPDGRSLVFVRYFGGGSSEIFLLRITGGVFPQGGPERLTSGGHLAINPAWPPDGKEIIYASGSKIHSCVLWRIAASGSGKPNPVPFSGDRTTASPAISLRNHHLVYRISSSDYNYNIWQYQIPRGSKSTSP